MAGSDFYPRETMVVPEMWNKGGKVSWELVLELGNLWAPSAQYPTGACAAYWEMRTEISTAAPLRSQGQG